MQFTDQGLYRCPVLRSVIAIISVCTLLEAVLQSGHLKVCSAPSGGMWVVSVLLFYCSRSVERRRGSYYITVILLSSCILAVGMLIAVIMSGHYSPSIFNGFVLYSVLVCILSHLLLGVRATHAYVLCGWRVSSHIFLFLLAIMVCLSSSTAVLSTICGLVGALTVYFLGPFPLPAMVVNGLLRAAHLIPDEYPPHRLSGATLAVQRQQRVNLVESVMIELQTPQMRHGAAQHQPPHDLVQILSGMGFQPEQARQALIATNGDITSAVQILTLQ